MVLLEIATLIMAGVGLADYYHTTVYRENLRQLKNKYGEHPDIDEAFGDICTLGGEYFKMPELILDKNNPHIDMGHFYSYDVRGPKQVLNEFFVTHDEVVYFNHKYNKEVERQANLRNQALRKMYDKIISAKNEGKLYSMGKTKINERRYKSPVMLAWDEKNYIESLHDICLHTIWGDFIEAGPNTYNLNCEFRSEWYLKEETTHIMSKEVLDLIFKCCYFHSKKYI